MTIEIIIDNRETKLKLYFQNNNYCSFKNLELGDIIIKYNKELVLIIERKRLDDLSSSIKDGRYKQQKLRLLNNYPNNKLLYIIEGDLNKPNDEKIKGLKCYTLTSSLINCLLRDNIMIYKTININETIKFIETFITKLEKQKLTFLNLKNKDDKLQEFQNSIIKKCKKENLTPETCFLAQLCQIPGISVKKANPIVKSYNSLSNLIITLSKINNDEKIELLSNIVISKKLNKNNKLVTRKIGKKTSIQIINYLFP